MAQLEDAFTEQQSQRLVIEAGERDEAIPWLRRTQRAVYLAGLDPKKLIQCVQRPAVRPIARPIASPAARLAAIPTARLIAIMSGLLWLSGIPWQQ